MTAKTVETPWRTLSGNIARAELNFIEQFGCYPRLVFEDREFTNLEELDRAGKLAHVLKDHGVRTGDRVLAILPNTPDMTASFQAVWMIGAVFAPIIPVWTSEEITLVLQNCEPTCVLTFPLAAPRVQAALTATKTPARLLVFGETDVPGAENLHPALESALPFKSVADRDDDHLALLLYTSGTTAAPRGAMLTHGNLRGAFQAMGDLNPDVARGKMLHALPLSHSFGVLSLEMANSWGWTTILQRQFDPTKALEAIHGHRVSFMPVVPTMLVYLLQHPALPNYDLSCLQRVISGGATLPEPVRIAFERVSGGRVEQGYGLSETAALVTAYGEHDPYRTWSAGRPAPGTRVAIFDENDHLVPAGQSGEIAVNGPQVMTGYWRDPEATRTAFAGEWLRTGDIGHLDDDGFLYITDRKKDLIIKGGENISPVEVEEALHNHPAVAAAAVIGIPDAVFGETVCAVLQLRPNMTVDEEEIRTFVTQHVGKFKAPSRVLVWPELPRNFTGKIWKRVIRSKVIQQHVAAATA